MTGIERRRHKRWLKKNDIWDGAEVIERLQKEGRLFVSNY